MAQGINENECIFTGEELKDINVLRIGRDHIEVTCGYTSRKYGDTTGRLRIFVGGQLEIFCECVVGCSEDKLTPAQFESHSARGQRKKNWKSCIWVPIKDKKVPLCKTTLLKYYKETWEGENGRSRPKRAIHRDEFIRCSSCNKERRFSLRTKEDCRIHHDASINKHWTCADRLNLTCEDKDERESRKMMRGCPYSPMCEGCELCVCFGCPECRFMGCNCRTCVDFYQNAEVGTPVRPLLQ